MSVIQGVAKVIGERLLVNVIDRHLLIFNMKTRDEAQAEKLLMSSCSLRQSSIVTISRKIFLSSAKQRSWLCLRDDQALLTNRKKGKG